MCVNIQNAAGQIDPTRTATIRKEFAGKLAGIFRSISADMRQGIVKDDALILNEAPDRNAFVFKTDAQKLGAFNSWLQRQFDNNLLKSTTTFDGVAVNDVSAPFIRRAYTAGVLRARSELNKTGFAVQPAEIAALLNAPIHRDQLAALFTRNFQSLKGISDATANAISQELAQGFATGAAPAEIAANISNRIEKIGITRARTLARTEVIRAHHLGNMAELDRLGVDDVNVMAEFVTAGDSRVCIECRTIEANNPYKIEDVRGLIPVHPNCRCVIVPLVTEVQIEDSRRIAAALQVA